MELAIATLPAGLDPCDLLVQSGGADAFRRILASAVDALEFKLTQMVSRENTAGVEGRRRVVDAVLGVIALASPLPGEAGAVKTQLMVNRIARRLALKEETVWARLDELRKQRRASETTPGRAVLADQGREERGTVTMAAPAAPEERQLLEVLLAEPALVATAMAVVQLEEIEHPGVRLLLSGLYALQAAGERPTLDHLRLSLENARLAERAIQLQEVGQAYPNRDALFSDLLAHFRRRREKTVKQELQSKLHAASDPRAAMELLRRLQNRSVELGTETSSRGDLAGTVPLAPPA
jgi:DNA primase